MNDLLKEFVELAPKEWDAELYNDPEDPPDSVTMMNDGYAYGFDLVDDRASAEALIFLLDWLEGRVGSVSVWLNSEQTYCTQWLPADIKVDFVHCLCGKTRIEAVLKAVVAVLQEKVTP